jgi:hypothetical protein
VVSKSGKFYSRTEVHTFSSSSLDISMALKINLLQKILFHIHFPTSTETVGSELYYVSAE